MPLFDFKCKHCGKVFEELVPHSVQQIECECGKQAEKCLSAPRISLDGTDPSYSGAYDRWARIRERRAAQAKKRSYYEP